MLLHDVHLERTTFAVQRLESLPNELKLGSIKIPKRQRPVCANARRKAEVRNVPLYTDKTVPGPNII